MDLICRAHQVRPPLSPPNAAVVLFAAIPDADTGMLSHLALHYSSLSGFELELTDLLLGGRGRLRVLRKATLGYLILSA